MPEFFVDPLTQWTRARSLEWGTTLFSFRHSLYAHHTCVAVQTGA
jgi:hypothetical protein